MAIFIHEKKSNRLTNNYIIHLHQKLKKILTQLIEHKNKLLFTCVFWAFCECARSHSMYVIDHTSFFNKPKLSGGSIDHCDRFAIDRTSLLNKPKLSNGAIDCNG